MNTTIAIYRTGEGWRWQMRDARNGRIIGASSEGYVRRAACLANLARVILACLGLVLAVFGLVVVVLGRAWRRM